MTSTPNALVRRASSEEDLMHDDNSNKPADLSRSSFECSTNWRICLPANAGDVRDISDRAFWTLSSCKTDGFGIQQLLEDNVDQYWQSDGPQPHTVTIEFSRKTDVCFLLLYLDYKTDESYTPSKVVVHLGSSVHDLDEGLVVMFTEPVGWQVLDLRGSNGRGSRAFVLQLQVVQNHQNGRDTHIRQMKVVGPARSRLDTDVKSLLSAGVVAMNLPLRFTSSLMANFSNIR